MPKNVVTLSNAKDAAKIAITAYVLVQAGRGWYYLGKDTVTAIKEHRAEKKTAE